MEIIFKKSVAGHNFSYRRGQVKDLPDKIAETFIESGAAESYGQATLPASIKETIEALEAENVSLKAELEKIKAESKAKIKETIEALEAENVSLKAALKKLEAELEAKTKAAAKK